MSHNHIMESMSQTDFYPHCPEKVELVQTHISYVFIAGDFVYKVKKPVNFGFLDFTTLEKRKFYCEEELRLNKRLAPSIYLDVVPIVQDDMGRLSPGGDGKTVEYAVRMKKLPLDKMLKILLAKGQADAKIMDAVAGKIARFHAAAQTGGAIDEMGSTKTIHRNHEENFMEIERYVDTTIPAYQYQFIKEYVERFLAVNKHLLKKRVAEHKIRDCHGDLHLEHICIADEIIIFDCIEFNERFRFSDVAAEVAFLTMDLDYNGYFRQAEDFALSYLKYSGDTDMHALLNFYRCYYAYVRGKVISFRLDQKEIPAALRAEIKQTALKYFDLAYAYAAHLEKPVLILTAGLIGSGKSYQARHLAGRLGADVIRTDVLRKELLRIAPAEKHHESFDQGIYTHDISRKTYEKAIDLAAEIIGQGKPVIIDASFKNRSDRKGAVDLAGRLHVPFYVIECTCPDDLVKIRLKKRMLDKDNPSDGRWEILQEQKKQYEEISEISEDFHFKVDTSGNPKIARQNIIRTIKMAELQIRK
ncbi:MAG: gluconate kinase [Syntrophaceae bacterium]|nr:MAG: gluconate kinase [Syntrophaceae bacterium]